MPLCLYIRTCLCLQNFIWAFVHVNFYVCFLCTYLMFIMHHRTCVCMRLCPSEWLWLHFFTSVGIVSGPSVYILVWSNGLWSHEWVSQSMKKLGLPDMTNAFNSKPCTHSASDPLFIVFWALINLSSVQISRISTKNTQYICKQNHFIIRHQP